MLVANLDPAGLGHHVEQVPLNLVVAAAGLSILGVLYFPWRRYDRNLFLVASLGGAFLVATAIYFSGGWQSPFFPLYFYVVVFAAIYYSRRVAAVVVVLTALVSVSPQLYDPDAARLAEHAMVDFPSYLALAVVSGYMAREIGKREHSRADKEHELGEERARLRLAQAGARVRAHEQRRIGRELHDRVAHAMGVAHQSLQLHEALSGRDPERAAEKLQLAKRAVVEAMGQTRDLSQALRREAQTAEGLRPALSEMISGLVPPGTAHDLSVSGEEEAVPDEVREQLFLVLREAVRNAVSHSEAAKVSVSVVVDGETVVGAVDDDGRGFDPGTVQGGGGGLAFMAERASMLGGTCSVECAPGKGARVEVVFPVGAEHSAQ